MSILLHLGAGQCSELRDHLASPAQWIHLVEADPTQADALRWRTRGEPRVRVHQFAVTGAGGEADLHLFNHRALNSLREPRGLVRLYPGLRQTGTRRVETLAIDVLLARLEGLDGPGGLARPDGSARRDQTVLSAARGEPPRCERLSGPARTGDPRVPDAPRIESEGPDRLIIDTPGEELGILQGLIESRKLARFPCIELHCGIDALYADAAPANAVLEALERQGYDRQECDRRTDPDRPVWTLCLLDPARDERALRQRLLDLRERTGWLERELLRLEGALRDASGLAAERLASLQTCEAALDACRLRLARCKENQGEWTQRQALFSEEMARAAGQIALLGDLLLHPVRGSDARDDQMDVLDPPPGGGGDAS